MEPSQAGGVLLLEFDEIDSTNAELMRRALAGERRPIYVRADRQTAGRGRSGRAWQTPPGNLALSRLVPLACPPQAVPQLSLVAGIAVHRAVSDLLAGTPHAAALRLKWPNDLLAGRAKLAGILVEATSIGQERIAVVGIGLNVAHAPEVEGRETVSLAAIGPAKISALQTLSGMGRHVARHLDEALAVWDDGRGFPALREEWLLRTLPLGTEMSVNAGPGGRVSGTFAGLDENGYLLLELSGTGRMIVTVGDVALIAG